MFSGKGSHTYAQNLKHRRRHNSQLLFYNTNGKYLDMISVGNLC